MYLRLKQHHPIGIAGAAKMHGDAPTLVSLRHELLRRHYAAFDWQNGGPAGPIKFIDLHQLELAGYLTRAGDDRARLMMNRYVRGIEQLISRPDSGAAHYATGPAWNIPSPTRTLAGQAVVIQALVITGRLKRSRAHARIVPALARFATARWIHAVSGDRRAGINTEDRAAVCELAWYVSALAAFAELYDNARLRAAAHSIFGQLTSRLLDANHELRHPQPELTLPDHVAIATLASEFSAARGDAGLAQSARRLLVACARRHAHPAGGWIQAYRDGAPPDLDCSIDFVRTADALHSRDHPELARIAAAGKRSLFQPEFALARTPESGLLLLLADASGNSAPRGTEVPGRNRRSRFLEDSDKLLVKIRK